MVTGRPIHEIQIDREVTWMIRIQSEMKKIDKQIEI